MLIFYSVVQVKKYIKFLEKTKKNCEDILLSDKFKISHLKHLDSFYPVGDGGIYSYLYIKQGQFRSFLNKIP